MKQDKGLLFFYDWLPVFENLNSEECKELIVAMLKYSKDGTEPPELNGGAKIASCFIMPAIDRAKASAEIGRRGGVASAASKESDESSDDTASTLEPPCDPPATPLEPSCDHNTIQYNTNTIQNNTIESTDAPARKTFVKPSVEEVAEYAKKQGYTGFDAQRFIDYYTANGWRVGKNPMKDWKAAVRNWASNDLNRGKAPPGESVKSQKQDYTPPADGSCPWAT